MPRKKGWDMNCLKMLFLSAGLFLYAFACVPTTTNVNDPVYVASNCKVEHDDFEKLTRYTGPNCSKSLAKSLFIRAWRKDFSYDVEYQIYVRDHYRSVRWRFYDSYYDSNGNFIEPIAIAREVGTCGSSGCWYNEILGITVTKEYLKAHRQSGIKFKISGSGGEEIFYIPSGYIAGILIATGP